MSLFTKTQKIKKSLTLTKLQPKNIVLNFQVKKQQVQFR